MNQDSGGTMTLTEFLLARIAEDEAAAHALGKEGMTQRLRDQSEEVAQLYGDPDPPEGDVKLADSLWFNAQDAADYADRFSAARVLAECEAKRRIVEEYTTAGRVAQEHPIVHEAYEAEMAMEFVCKALALPDADHPDYREEWRP